jgi:hypothetical protein
MPNAALAASQSPKNGSGKVKALIAGDSLKAFEARAMRKKNNWRVLL